jgi:predicted phosphodiesterase
VGRIAIISDIHANLEALLAVLKDAERKKVAKFYCLGDIIGYGPSPREVLERVIDISSETVRGNHEEIVVRSTQEDLHPAAVKAAEWTRKQLKPVGSVSSAAKRERWEWLKALPLTEEVKDGEILLAHGTPEDCFEYIMSSDEARAVFAGQMGESRMLFIGHSHVPGIFFEDERRVRFLKAERKKRFSFPEMRVIVNVGSVGQPRDYDPRASYVLLHPDETFEFRRVEYDAEKTAERIFAIPELPRWLGERLLCGE